MTTLEPYHIDRTAPCLIVADHAGRVVPEGVELGVDPDDLARHIGWDIGAAIVTRQLADRLSAPALLCHVTRLVIDPNRRPRLPSSMPVVSDGTVVPGNRDLSEEDVQARIREHFLPYHRAIARWIGAKRRDGIAPVLIAVHSFTPRMLGTSRPWQVGVLWRGDRRISAPLLDGLRRDPSICVGDNLPYSGQEDFGYTINFHAQRTHIPHVMVELRQNEIDRPDTALAWADRLADLLVPILADPGLYELYGGDNLETLPEGMSWRDAASSSASVR
ncbi:MAG TPA: N-formylglutamate amidohydrolase [Geminicoccus sp.]|jgi:predicted N-formylglutamate amidohydrolase|uniref:N-formylglutamate amidohydrolase n=1 Tax=Geminicoccus sp. TaxID=2024832 RepID=UPI002E33854C|nr:N-formylglutamate amidohydrolase [Geminicoccus sp.]HEX2528274.1 N-formylglutamate amidohydrolase [Geminicoccus sp.]